ncbi:iron complex transport system substrate-binding protein [Nitratireductor aquibiodomus]|uniref:Iron complex transport system substrate-binding protein n=1 Tax=Nitratireductor aquibiodomus TaxID=204799 RepID=A0A1H4LT82_9HYPH|nr:ABC transporter substrate-binding protein [Nitratireductor aquibiodomus]SEB73475.1 iron complex transport system substrate-binding protein [Nitratireductor aquibiodomus]
MALRLRKLSIRVLLFWLCAVACGSAQAQESGPVRIVDALGRDVRIETSRRVLTLGSDVTEIVFALGAGDRIVAVDRGSRFPEAASSKHNVGYRRRLSAEGVLSLDPDLILAAEDIGPPEVVEVLKKIAIPMVLVPKQNTGEGIRRKIALIASALALEAEGRALAGDVLANFEKATKLTEAIPVEKRRKVVFFHGVERLTAAGAGTAADAIIRYAGGLNPMDRFEGYKAASEEDLIELAPDTILMMSNGRGGPTREEVFSNRALALTPAARTGSLIVLDGAYMIGFGPRTTDAIRDLAEALYGAELAPAID